MSIILENAFTKISTVLRFPCCIHAQSSPHSWRPRLVKAKTLKFGPDHDFFSRNRLSTFSGGPLRQKRSVTGADRTLLRVQRESLERRDGAPWALAPPLWPGARELLFVRHTSTTSLARLSPQVVTGILRRNEVSVSQGLGPSVARYDCNQVGERLGYLYYPYYNLNS